MQLWQFLYTLLHDPDKKYQELIEWTANVKSREFRLLEPESIAIWWGEHKNKRNMSYDKLSRSLRYYYDKGIIRKIPGERYVYQFRIDPELMYKHIGNSDCRPKLKPMPHSAKMAMSKYASLQPGGYSMHQQEPPYVVGCPVPLAAMHPGHTPGHQLVHPCHPNPYMLTGPPLPPSFPLENTHFGPTPLELSLPTTLSHIQEDLEVKQLEMRRCHSFGSCFEQKPIFEQFSPPMHSPVPPLINGVADHLESFPFSMPSHANNSRESSPVSDTYCQPITNPNELDFLIELTSNNYSATQSPVTYSSAFDTKASYDNHMSWNYS